MRVHGCGGGVSTRPLVRGIFFFLSHALSAALVVPGTQYPAFANCYPAVLACAVLSGHLASIYPQGPWSPVHRHEALQSGDLDQFKLAEGATE